MIATLLFDFTVNKENNTINIKREFAAGLDLIWDAWTKPEILDQWWAPKPFRVKTKSMDFREGGAWHYAMIGPDNTTFWSKAEYKKIDIKKNFTGLDGFCDEKGSINPDFPRSLWSNTFSKSGEHTLVNVTVKYDTLSDLEKIIQMGFKEGFTMALGNLDQYIEAQFKLRQQYKQSNATRVATYVNFPGNTEEAFNFYKKVFKTDFIGGKVQRFGDVPADPSHPPIPEPVKKMVLHVQLPLMGGHILMGTDAPKEMGFTLTRGNNMHICLEPETREETKRIFDELSLGGNVTMPLQDMFWGAYFAEFSDKYGINWMVNHQEKSRT